MKTYQGYRLMHKDWTGAPTTMRCVVKVRSGGRVRELNKRHDVRTHSAEFELGYGGSGPAQLALALIADACGKRVAKAEIYQRFKWRVITSLPKDGWTMTQAFIQDTVTEIEKELLEGKL